jgi:branched-chain amino acid transport system permease protein
MDTVFITIVHGLNLAAIYGLMAIGISLLWSSIGMINMAHGATFAVSGYAAWLVSDALKATILATFGKTALGTAATAGVTLATGTLAGAAMGALIYALAFLPIHDKPNFAVRSLIVTLAINLATVQALLWWFGPKQKNLPKIFGTGKVDLGFVSARYDQIGAILSTALILALVLAWLRVSRKGLEIRAMMQNPEGAVLSGISVRRTALPVTMLTGALAGLAAVLLSQTIFVSPTSGAMPLIKGLTIALLGGLGSVPGAVAGAVIIGFLEASIGAIPFLGQRYVLFGTFVFIIAVLIVRPRGIGGLLDEARK